MKNTEVAFHWIIDVLEKNAIPYKISGGLAARAHGTHRELADIDIEVTDQMIPRIAKLVREYIIFGPSHYQDTNWDLYLMTLNYNGQEIDISGMDAKIFNQQLKIWEPHIGN